MHAYRKDGTVVLEGDVIISFRGEEWTFISLTRGGRRVLARMNGSDWEQELYPSVFALEVR